VTASSNLAVSQLVDSHELEVDSLKLEVGVVGYQSRVLSCIVTHYFQATTGEDIKDLVFAVVIFRVCRVVKMLTIICSYKLQAFNKISYQSKPHV
jgi:hypothetical protein